MKEVKEKKEKVKRKLSSRAKKVIVLGCFCVLLLVTQGNGTDTADGAREAK